MAANILSKVKNLMQSYFTLSGYLVTQAEAEASIREGVSFRGPNILILILAILIASLGLNTNSTAVIIGAMLISPLMGPIIGLGLGVGIMDFDLLKRSLRNLIMAAGFSVIASTIYFAISPVSEGHSELLARTSPTIYDVLIGFVGGGAGILAIGSRSKGNVIPGVAIATALMPPLCTAGYGLATLQFSYFFGAFYLFLINSIFIALATFIGVKMMRFKPAAVVNVERARKVRRVVYIVAVLTLLPSIYLTWSMLRQSHFQINAQRFVAEECRFPNTHVLSTSTSWHKGQGTINITLIGKVLPQDSLQLALSSQLKYYNLGNATINIMQGETPTLNASQGPSSVRDMYDITISALAAKQATVDSLRAVLQYVQASDSVSATVMPELKVVFPSVRSIAMSKAIFASADSSRLDTVNLALINCRPALSESAKKELAQYLNARLKLKDVKLVDISASTLKR